MKRKPFIPQAEFGFSGETFNLCGEVQRAPEVKAPRILAEMTPEEREGVRAISAADEDNAVEQAKYDRAQNEARQAQLESFDRSLAYPGSEEAKVRSAFRAEFKMAGAEFRTRQANGVWIVTENFSPLDGEPCESWRAIPCGCGWRFELIGTPNLCKRCKTAIAPEKEFCSRQCEETCAAIAERAQVARKEWNEVGAALATVPGLRAGSTWSTPDQAFLKAIATGGR